MGVRCGDGENGKGKATKVRLGEIATSREQDGTYNS